MSETTVNLDTVHCPRCLRSWVVGMTPEQHAAWKAGGPLQVICPDMDVNLRELLISGECGHCFDELCGEPDTEEGDDEPAF